MIIGNANIMDRSASAANTDWHASNSSNVPPRVSRLTKVALAASASSTLSPTMTTIMSLRLPLEPPLAILVDVIPLLSRLALPSR